MRQNRPHNNTCGLGTLPLLLAHKAIRLEYLNCFFCDVGILLIKMFHHYVTTTMACGNVGLADYVIGVFNCDIVDWAVFC